MAAGQTHGSRWSDPLDDADDDELVTGEAVALDLRPASFVLRATGSIIDFVVTVLVLLGGFFVIVGIYGGFGVDDAAVGALFVTLLVVCTIVVPTAVETLSMGKSLGKLVMGVRIVRDDGGAVGFRHAFIRALTGFIEIIGTFGGLAAIVALLNGRAKRLGDLLAGTYAQYERVADPGDPIFAVPPELVEWSRIADVARMPDRLSRRVTQFLGGASAFLPEARARIGASLASEAAGFVDPVPAAAPEAFLIAITAIRRERESRALDLERERMARLEPVLRGLPHGFPDRD
ncbi:MAG: hypothetical protein RI885_616 [Actinomycetota bacterium]